jgi:hypothetical protein
MAPYPNRTRYTSTENSYGVLQPSGWSLQQICYIIYSYLKWGIWMLSAHNLVVGSLYFDWDE